MRTRYAPMLLLLAVVAGLFTMHTIGHLTGHAAGSHPAAMTMSSGPHAAHADAPAGPAESSVAALTSDRGGLPGDLMALCLAILSAIATFAAALTLLRRHRVTMPPPNPSAWAAAAASRAPPLLIGLRLADLSVLRH
ncbi:MAG: hypothetical protein HOV79_33170 [Hamadaea sp.]|nr:hypothetical protein [Hamadaea sp.]